MISARDFATAAMERGLALFASRRKVESDPRDADQASFGRMMCIMCETQGWKAYHEILSVRHKRVLSDLAHKATAEDFRLLQVEAKLIEELLNQPEVWIQEGKEAESRMASQLKEMGNG